MWWSLDTVCMVRLAFGLHLTLSFDRLRLFSLMRFVRLSHIDCISLMGGVLGNSVLTTSCFIASLNADSYTRCVSFVGLVDNDDQSVDSILFFWLFTTYQLCVNFFSLKNNAFFQWLSIQWYLNTSIALILFALSSCVANHPVIYGKKLFLLSSMIRS